MPNTQIWAHSTVRFKGGTHVRTSLYRHPSFTKASKARNRINPGSSRGATAVYNYHRSQFGHRSVAITGNLLGGAITRKGGKPGSGSSSGTVAVNVVRGMKARRQLRPSGMRRSAILGTQRYQVRAHGNQPVVHHPLNRHLRASTATSRSTKTAHKPVHRTAVAHHGRRNVRVRRGAHGHFAGSY